MSDIYKIIRVIKFIGAIPLFKYKKNMFFLDFLIILVLYYYFFLFFLIFEDL